MSVFVRFLIFRLVPMLQTEPALILLGARESTTVPSHRSCLPTAHGKRVKPIRCRNHNVHPAENYTPEFFFLHQLFFFQSAVLHGKICLW